MAYPADFVDAHRRHWEDAELLFGQSHLANADQLYGFSAECGLKAVMKALGMGVDSMGIPLESEHRKHVQDLWNTFTTFVRGRSGARYIRMLPPGSPFQDWSHHNRYAHHRHFTQGQVGPHRAAAANIEAMVQHARRDGIL